MGVSPSLLQLMVWGVLFAGEVGILSFHIPSRSAIAVNMPIFQVTVTFTVWPTGALPHITRGFSRWTTILLCNTLDTDSAVITGGTKTGPVMVVGTVGSGITDLGETGSVLRQAAKIMVIAMKQSNSLLPVILKFAGGIEHPNIVKSYNLGKYKNK